MFNDTVEAVEALEALEHEEASVAHFEMSALSVPMHVDQASHGSGPAGSAENLASKSVVTGKGEVVEVGVVLKKDNETGGPGVILIQ
jgi:hypothetical protein